MDVAVMSLGGGEPRVIAGEPYDEAMPRWSPDGSKIAFLADAGEGQDVYWVPPTGGAAPRIASTGFRYLDRFNALRAHRVATVVARWTIPGLLSPRAGRERCSLPHRAGDGRGDSPHGAAARSPRLPRGLVSRRRADRVPPRGGGLGSDLRRSGGRWRAGGPPRSRPFRCGSELDAGRPPARLHLVPRGGPGPLRSRPRDGRRAPADHGSERLDRRSSRRRIGSRSRAGLTRPIPFDCVWDRPRNTSSSRPTPVTTSGTVSRGTAGRFSFSRVVPAARRSGSTTSPTGRSERSPSRPRGRRIEPRTGLPTADRSSFSPTARVRFNYGSCPPTGPACGDCRISRFRWTETGG